eukprot:7253674-Alexandrium_andersonii.AAC.1
MHRWRLLVIQEGLPDATPLATVSTFWSTAELTATSAIDVDHHCLEPACQEASIQGVGRPAHPSACLAIAIDEQLEHFRKVRIVDETLLTLTALQEDRQDWDLL